MTRRRRRTAALALAAIALGTAASPASAHKANPNFLSRVDTVTPQTSGVTVQVLNRDDQLLLHNTSGKTVVVSGYEHEPYARVLGDGTVQVNTNSPAYYLNRERFTTVKVPAGVKASNPPRWKELDKTGRLQWHDHRMHWMLKTRPPQVKDPSKRTKVDDWTVPITIGGQRGGISGTLFWTPRPGGSMPVGVFIGSAILIALLLAVTIRRRRGSPSAAPSAPARPTQEAW